MPVESQVDKIFNLFLTLLNAALSFGSKDCLLRDPNISHLSQACAEFEKCTIPFRSLFCSSGSVISMEKSK